MIKFHYNTPSVAEMEKQSSSTSERKILCAIPLLLLLSRLDARLKAHYLLWRKNYNYWNESAIFRSVSR